MQKSRIPFLELGLFLVLVLVLAASRHLIETPNFKPIAAMGLLAGFFFRRFWLALSLPLLAMISSDLVLGGYDRPIMLAVYASLTLCPCLGWICRTNTSNRTWAQLGSLSLAALVMSIAFYLITNLVVWTVWYESSTAGLIACYVAALPFFKYTLVSNLLFTGTGYCLVRVVRHYLDSVLAKQKELNADSSESVTA